MLKRLWGFKMAKIPVTVSVEENIKKMAEAIPYSQSYAFMFGVQFLYAQHVNTTQGKGWTAEQFPDNMISKKLERAMEKIKFYADKYGELEQ